MPTVPPAACRAPRWWRRLARAARPARRAVAVAVAVAEAKGVLTFIVLTSRSDERQALPLPACALHILYRYTSVLCLPTQVSNSHTLPPPPTRQPPDGLSPQPTRGHPSIHGTKTVHPDEATGTLKAAFKQAMVCRPGVGVCYLHSHDLWSWMRSALHPHI